MEFAEVVRGRRMVRGFLDAPVPTEVVERLVERIRYAPSAGFAQGVAAVVVTEGERRRAVAVVAGEARYTAAGHRPWISEAPVQIVLCASEEVYHRRYREPDKLRPDGAETEWPIPYWYTDAGAALMLLLLGAVDAGLSAAFVGVYRWRELQALLGIPAEFVPIGVVLVGYGAPHKRSASLARGHRPLDEIVHREAW